MSARRLMDEPDLMASLRARAQAAPQRLVFPEAGEESILRAVRLLVDEGLARPILLGSPGEVRARAAELGVDLQGVDILDVTDEAVREPLASACRLVFPEITQKGIDRRLRSPLEVSALLVAADGADAMIAGIRHSTEEVILAAMTYLGMQAGITAPSSMMLLRVPGYRGPEGECVVFADCAVTVAPDATELADIACATAHTARVLLRWEPRVAMLSFSTRGSGDHESVDRVREAVRLARDRDPTLLIDGELQLDAAVTPEVAARKVPGESAVAGRANVLICPDLTAANIACKCVQRFAGGDAYGPFLQGFAKTVSDLSRGASVADVVGGAVLAAVHAQGLKGL